MNTRDLIEFAEWFFMESLTELPLGQELEVFKEYWEEEGAEAFRRWLEQA